MRFVSEPHLGCERKILYNNEMNVSYVHDGHTSDCLMLYVYHIQIKNEENYSVTLSVFGKESVKMGILVRQPFPFPQKNVVSHDTVFFSISTFVTSSYHLSAAGITDWIVMTPGTVNSVSSFPGIPLNFLHPIVHVITEWTEVIITNVYKFLVSLLFQLFRTSTFFLN